MKYLITGTGRCGTGFMANVFTSVGLNCTHEQVFNRNGLVYALEQIELRRKYPEWGWAGESSWLASPFLMHPDLKDLIVIHLVRHPLNVINSNLRLHFFTHPHYGPYFNWMSQYVDLDKYDNVYEKAVYWYLELNKFTEQRADIRHRVEDDPRILLDQLGINYSGYDIYDNTKYNSRTGYGNVKLNVGQVHKGLVNRLAEMSYSYGYN